MRPSRRRESQGFESLLLRASSAKIGCPPRSLSPTSTTTSLGVHLPASGPGSGSDAQSGGRQVPAELMRRTRYVASTIEAPKQGHQSGSMT